MIYFDRTDVSEGIDNYKTNQKSVMFVTIVF